MLEVNIVKKLNRFTLKADLCISNETVALFGSSGSGKSMTLKCIAGIETPDSGRIILNDRVLFDSDKKINVIPQKRKVGYMFQDYALFQNMTVRENVAAGVTGGLTVRSQMTKKEISEEIDFYLNKFKLKDIENEYPGRLSGGQKQRCALARMLAAKPEVILLDEPFSSLDYDLKDEMIENMLDVLKTEDKPALFVSHNRDEVNAVCNKIIYIKDGET